MKVFKVIEPSVRLFAKGPAILRSFGIEVKGLGKYAHPQEDFLTVSKKHPIFAVADGVTLESNLDGTYPRVSGAEEAAKIFCEVVVKEIEKIYKNFSVPDLKKVFATANAAVGKYNHVRGRVKGKLNYWDFDLFAATAALAVVKNHWVYWASICDSGIAHFGKEGRLKFRSKDNWNVIRKNLPPDWLKIPEKERKKIIRSTYRNGVNSSGQLIGYGVATGEQAAERYLNFGRFSVKADEVVMVFSDGFENYLKVGGFAELFLSWPKNLKSRLKKITRHKSVDDPGSFGRERTLIAVMF